MRFFARLANAYDATVPSRGGGSPAQTRRTRDRRVRRLRENDAGNGPDDR
jgi:hypothetical protein